MRNKSGKPVNLGRLCSHSLCGGITVATSEQRQETGRKQDAILDSLVRTHAGRWAKGQSANPATQWKPGFCPKPKGRPPFSKAEVIEADELMCRLYERLAVTELLQQELAKLAGNVRPHVQTAEDDASALELINSLRSLGVRVSVVGGSFYDAKLQLKPANKIPRKMLLRIIEAKQVLIAALRHRHAGCVPSCHENEGGGWTHCPKDGCMSLPGELLEWEGLLPRSRAKEIVL